MKKKNINLADIIGLTLLLGLIFAPSYKVKTFSLERITSLYFMAYLAVFFLRAPKRSGLYLIFPLLIHTLIIFYLLKGASFLNNKEVFRDFYRLMRISFPIISLALAFYIIERLVSRLFGTYFTIFLGILALILYLLMGYRDFLKDYYDYRYYLIYLSVFLIFANFKTKKSYSWYFYLFGLLILGLEVYLYLIQDFYLGIFIGPLILIFLILTSKKKKARLNFEKYFIFTLFFIYPTVSYSLDSFLYMKPFYLRLASVLISFFVSLIFYEAKIKAFSRAFLSIG